MNEMGIGGDDELEEMPPHSRKFGAWKPAKPIVIVKRFKTEAAVSPVTNSATVLAPPPSMVVFEAPCTLVTVIALPLKLMFSLYVPSSTNTVSPLFAASIAAWMVGWSAGT